MQRMPIIGNLQLCVSGIPYKALDYAYMSSFNSVVANAPIKDLRVPIDFKQNGSGDPSTSNLRTFNTFTTCNIYRTGKSLKDTSHAAVRSIGGQMYNALSDTILPPGIYTVGGTISTASNYSYYIHIENYSRTSSSEVNIPSPSTSESSTAAGFTLTDWSYVTIRSSSQVKIEDQFEHLMVERGNAGTSYTAYTGSNVTVDLQSTESGAYYGGILNVTTGDFVIDKVFIDLSSLVWEPWTSVTNGFTVSPHSYSVTHLPKYFPKFNPLELIECDTSFGFTASRMNPQVSHPQNKIITGSSNPSYPGITITYNGFSSYWGSSFNLSAFQAALTNWQAVVTIPESQRVTLHLSPASVKTLSGINNVWSDRGKVALKYV